MEYQCELYRDDLPLIGDLKEHENNLPWDYRAPMAKRCQIAIDQIAKLGGFMVSEWAMGNKVAIFSITTLSTIPSCRWCAMHISDGRTIYVLGRAPEINAGIFKTLSLATKAILLPELIKGGHDGVVRHLELK
jgi:hypothetical protein